MLRILRLKQFIFCTFSFFEDFPFFKYVIPRLPQAGRKEIVGISIIPVTKAPPLELQNPDTTPTPYPEFQQLQRFGKKKNNKQKKQQHEEKVQESK